MNFNHLQNQSKSDVVDSLPNKTMIDVEKSILNSITDNKYDKLVEGCNKIGEALKKVGAELATAIRPFVEWCKELNGDYKWQDDAASY